MEFQKAVFIKSDAPFVRTYEKTCPAPLFRKRFSVGAFHKAQIAVCALGYGEFYLNGKRITEDKLIAPVSDYTKTVWYTVYDVTGLLQQGENVFAAVLGNGWYNEPFKTSWDYEKAPWRDQPKLLMELLADGTPVVWTGEGWLSLRESAIIYNHLRSGEHFDARLHLKGWNGLSFDDSLWGKAIIDDAPPSGTLRQCFCPPIREMEIVPTKRVIRAPGGKWVFDIGRNISGYVRLSVCEKAGTEIVIRYSEELNEDGTLNLNRMFSHYKESDFMTDRFISDGTKWVWSPRFTYHGFRYVEISGLSGVPSPDTVAGVFLHQAAKPLSGFICSDERLTELFAIGQTATLSNLMYMPTDCPTREKLGWANDAQASCEQMLLNFDTAEFFGKWLQDIHDAMRDDGAMPGIIPTSGWGYEWGNGPVSDGILFEVPFRLYHFTGDKTPLTKSLPFFRRYFAYLETRREADGHIHFGLDDWAPPTPNGKSKTPASIINAILRIKFLRIASLAARLEGTAPCEFDTELALSVKTFQKDFINADGTVNVPTMTAAAMVIHHSLYTDFEAVKNQLLGYMQEYGYHHDCGMVGLPCLYPALNAIGREDLALRVLTAEGYPGFIHWLDQGATTLWETWQCRDSHNHHMYSSFMAWLIKTPGGIEIDHAGEDSMRVTIRPSFVNGLDWVRAHRCINEGKIEVSWMREGEHVRVNVYTPKRAAIVLNGSERMIDEGAHEFVV